MGDAARNLNEYECLQHGAGALAPVLPFRPRPLPDAPERAILAFPAGLLPHLPVPLQLELEANGQRFAVVLDDVQAEADRARGALVLDGRDWELLVLGVESDRLRPIDLGPLLALRRERRLAEADVLAGARGEPPRGSSTAQVLARLGVLLRTCAPLEPAQRDAA
jgi:hypothetical protein